LTWFNLEWSRLTLDKGVAMAAKIDVMISKSDVQQRIAEMAACINAQYASSDKDLVLIGLLRGSFIFMADLCRALDKAHELDFMTVSSYGNHTESTRDVKILKDLDGQINGKDVLVVEDIIDSGNTLSKVIQILATRNPHSITLCTLISKPSRREVNIDVSYVGFEVEDKFIVGYGLDYAQKYRHLPYIGVINSMD
jgi:hypoxanthine phosphoribosyltransferase